jgi:hypothetical protein
LAALKTDEDDRQEQARTAERSRRNQLGLLAVVLSFVLYVLIFVMPFMPGSTEARIAGAAVLYGVSYLAFFVGGALLGPAVMTRGKQRVRSFFRREPPAPPPADDRPSGAQSPSSASPSQNQVE